MNAVIAPLRIALLVTTCFVVGMGGGVVGARITAKRDRATTVAAIADAVREGLAKGTIVANGPTMIGAKAEPTGSRGKPAVAPDAQTPNRPNLPRAMDLMRRLRQPTPALDAQRAQGTHQDDDERRLDALGKRIDDQSIRLQLHQERLAEAEGNINKISHILEQMTSSGSSDEVSNPATEQAPAPAKPAPPPARPPWLEATPQPPWTTR